MCQSSYKYPLGHLVLFGFKLDLAISGLALGLATYGLGKFVSLLNILHVYIYIYIYTAGFNKAR